MSTRKPAILTALAVSCLLTAAARPAHAEWDIGGVLGGHFFSNNLKLGRQPTDPSGNNLRNQILIGIRVAYLPIPQLSIEAEGAIIPTSTVNPTLQEPIVTVRGHALWNILTGRVRPFILFGGGVLIGTRTITDTQTQGQPTLFRRDADGMFYTGAGFKFDITNNFGFRLDGRFLFPPALANRRLTTDYEVLWSLYGRIGNKAPDRDKDGVTDDKDKCPKEPGPAENGGCPDVDSDGDGIVDRLDKCPKQAGVRELDGCPDPDSDGDGIVDRLDKCPNAAGPRENGGCPDVDSDGDGIVDRLDKCPNQAGVRELDGCPDPDTDGDGIVDRKDKCPDKPETKNNYQDEDGCPDEIPTKLRRFTGAIKGINFATGKDIILKSSFPTLDNAAAVLKEFGDAKMEIQGHTDNVGKPDDNKLLSQKRADAVRNYLLGKGIEGSRLTAVGFGQDKPIAPNTTNAGRAKNRRVEFQLVQ